MGKGILALIIFLTKRTAGLSSSLVSFLSNAFFLFLGLSSYDEKEAVRFVYASFVLVMNSSFILRMSQDGTIKIKYRLNKAIVRLLVRRNICVPYMSSTVWWDS